MPETPIETIHGGPEAVLRVTDLATSPAGATGLMRLGPWSTGPDGRTSLGALGVLVDDVLGYAIVAHAPAGKWSVSIEITLDALHALPGPGAVLTASASLLRADARGSYAEGLVRDSDGQPVARASQRGRWVDLAAFRDPHLPWERVHEPDGTTGFADVFREPSSSPGEYLLRSDDVTSNNMGMVHGGTAIAAAAAVAESVLAAGPGSPLTVTSLRTHYPRPTLTGSRIDVEAWIVHRGRSLAIVDVATTAAGAVRTLTRVAAEG